MLFFERPDYAVSHSYSPIVYANDFDIFITEVGHSRFKKTTLNVDGESDPCYTGNKRLPVGNTLFFFLKGGGYFQDGDKKYNVSEGDICITSNAKPYTVSYKPNTEQIYINFNMNTYSVNDLFSDINRPLIYKDKAGIGKMIFEAFKTEDLPHSIYMKGLIFQALYPFLTDFSEQIRQLTENSKKYSFVFNYINANFNASLTTTEIAAALHVSPSFLKKKFVKDTGFTVKKFIEKRLLEKTFNELRYTDIRIKDIAIKYGFSSEYYFSDWFLKNAGYRPSSIRKGFTGAHEHFSLY